MNISNPEELKTFLRHSGLKPKDYLGQNFLVDEEVLAAIVSAADLQPTDTVLEVGPGLGVLTTELLKQAGKVIAVEKDQRLYEILKKMFAISNEVRDPSSKRFLAPLEIVNQDILRFHLDEYISGPYKVVANIPYYLTSKLFQYFLEQKNKPKLMVLMVQKEVGERVVAESGELSVLGISVQIYADPEIILNVSKDSFWPAPKVDSVVIRIVPKLKYAEIKDEKLFFRLIKIAFAGKRKQVHNTLANGLKIPKEEVLALLAKAGIAPTLRPQDVKIEQWIKLYQQFNVKG